MIYNNAQNLEVFTQQTCIFKTFLPHGWKAFEESTESNSILI